MKFHLVPKDVQWQNSNFAGPQTYLKFNIDLVYGKYLNFKDKINEIVMQFFYWLEIGWLKQYVTYVLEIFWRNAKHTGTSTCKRAEVVQKKGPGKIDAGNKCN